ncbi:substrate-binding domain-containing protein [Cerasicoccus fimbriatus]|uniref:substrate-binding domain-containing protein n=1 Tax=Cerasicoccus fimbriatus TaxID=3014554 RepID=UPI0022B42290|nr:substrate-binding domain-containing protein [Cerasicoccus sp. TK19100]
MPRKKGQQVIKLEKEILKLLKDGNWDPSNPLPVTRDLADKFGVSNVTAHRVLRRFNKEGLVWRSDSGRYFLPSGREMAERPKPVFCLVRELTARHVSYRLMLQGFSRQCAEARRSLLFPSDVRLVTLTEPEEAPQFQNSVEQLKSFRRVLRTNPQSQHGFLLDHLWHEDVLDHCVDDLRNAVLLWRSTKVEGISSVSIDYDTAGRQAISHLLDQNYERIIIAIPFKGDSAVDQMAEAGEKAARELTQFNPEDVCLATNNRERQQLVELIRNAPERIGIFCLEDSVCKLLLDTIRLAGIRCPEKVGIISGMGTEIAHLGGLSTVDIPFVEMGSVAGKLIGDRIKQNKVLPTKVIRNLTT